MGTNEILKEIRKLPLQKQILLLEKTLKNIREEELNVKMRNAVEILLNDYKTDNVLTEFTALDTEQFYETR
jgi:hypothetical protein